MSEYLSLFLVLFCLVIRLCLQDQQAKEFSKQMFLFSFVTATLRSAGSEQNSSCARCTTVWPTHPGGPSAAAVDAATCDSTVDVQPTENLAGDVGEADSEHTEPAVSVCAAHIVDAAACDGTVRVQPTEY